MQVRKTKIDLIKEHLMTGRTLTQLEAIGLYSAFRLAARIHELKKQGWNIQKNEKRDANGSIYVEYYLADSVLNPHGLPEFALPSQVALPSDAPFAGTSEALHP